MLVSLRYIITILEKNDLDSKILKNPKASLSCIPQSSLDEP